MKAAAGERAPSLERRVAGTVVLSFAVIFVMLFVVLWQQAFARDTGEMDRALLKAASDLVRALDTLDSEDGARAVLMLFDDTRTGADTATHADREPPVYVSMARLDGSGAQAHHQARALDLATLPGGRSTQQVDGQEWRLYVAAGQRWRVALADVAPVRERWLGWTLFTDLALYLGMALPVVLLPVWLLTRATLRPLRRLSQTVAARSPLDTTPLPPERRWRELRPLEDALNRLFERTAAGLAREKAFVHDAAHELRTPLAVIATQAHVLAQAEGPQREAARRRLHDAVGRASHLTQQLLQLAQADAAARVEPVALDLMDLLRDAMALLAERAAAQGTELDLQGPDHAPLRSDPRALRSIIDNLLDNALRYGGRGGLVTVRVELEAAQLTLSVADQGPGLAADEQERIFERFHRGRASHTQPGSGLGLAIVREAAQALGGRAEARGSEGGALFVVVLPREASVQAEP